MKIKALSLSLLAVTALSLGACNGSDGSATAGDKSKAGTQDDPKLTQDRAREGALGDMVLGNPDADVTLIEFASLTCGHCASFHHSVYPTIKEKYIDAGKIKFVFRELPTPPHDRSLTASLLARCTTDKGGDKAYFVITDAMFKTQAAWAFGTDPVGELQKIANQAGMNNEAMKECLGRQEILDVINTNVKEAGERFKITGTPSFVLNGEKLDLKTLGQLDEELAVATGTELPVEEAESAEAAHSADDNHSNTDHSHDDPAEDDHSEGDH